MGFFDASGKAVKFVNPGDSVTGRVMSWTERQAKVYGTDELATWQDGSPKMEALVVLDTDVLDDEDDDGARTIYVASTRQKRALIDALRRGGSKAPEEGGTLTMTYTGDDQNSKNPRQPAKMYTAQWQKPDARSVVFDTGGVQGGMEAVRPGQQAQTSPGAQDPWQPAAQESKLSAGTVEKIRNLKSMGLAVDVIVGALASEGVTAADVQAA